MELHMNDETCSVCGFPAAPCDENTSLPALCDECAAYYEMTDPNGLIGVEDD